MQVQQVKLSIEQVITKIKLRKSAFFKENLEKCNSVTKKPKQMKLQEDCIGFFSCLVPQCDCQGYRSKRGYHK